MDKALSMEDPYQALSDLLNQAGRQVPTSAEAVHMFRHCEDDRDDDCELQAGMQDLEEERMEARNARLNAAVSEFVDAVGADGVEKLLRESRGEASAAL